MTSTGSIAIHDTTPAHAPASVNATPSRSDGDDSDGGDDDDDSGDDEGDACFLSLLENSGVALSMRIK